MTWSPSPQPSCPEPLLRMIARSRHLPARRRPPALERLYILISEYIPKPEVKRDVRLGARREACGSAVAHGDPRNGRNDGPRIGLMLVIAEKLLPEAQRVQWRRSARRSPAQPWGGRAARSSRPDSRGSPWLWSRSSCCLRSPLFVAPPLRTGAPRALGRTFAARHGATLTKTDAAL